MDKKTLKQMSKHIARFVRDSLEDLHGENIQLTDENMPSVNRAIRAGIYQYLLMMSEIENPKHSEGVKRKLRYSFYTLKSPPQYREDDVLKKEDKAMDRLLKMFRGMDKEKKEKPH